MVASKDESRKEKAIKSSLIERDIILAHEADVFELRPEWRDGLDRMSIQELISLADELKTTPPSKKRGAIVAHYKKSDQARRDAEERELDGVPPAQIDFL